MTRGHRVPPVTYLYHPGPRMDKIQIFARCNNSELAFVCPVTRVLKTLRRLR